MSSADPNAVIVTGENPFIRLSATDSDDYTTNASFWYLVLAREATLKGDVVEAENCYQHAEHYFRVIREQ